MRETEHRPTGGCAAGPEDSPRDEPPPFGRSWRVLYALVLLNLVLMILLFYAFTRAFS